MYLVVKNYLFIQNASVAAQLILWVIVILLVCVLAYLLLKKLNQIQDKVVNGTDEQQYIPAERVKQRIVINLPPDVPAEPFIPPVVLKEPVTETENLPPVEYISVPIPRISEPAPVEQALNKTNEQNTVVAQDAHVAENIAGNNPVDKHLINYPEQQFNDHLASIEHITEQDIPDAALTYQPGPIIETVFAEKAPTPVLHDTPASAPLFDQEKYKADIPTSDSEHDINNVLNSLSEVIFEYDERKHCVNLWYNQSQTLITNPEAFRGKTPSEVVGAEKAKIINDALDFVAANLTSATIEFPSFYDTDKWFRSRISPVFDAGHQFTGHTTSLISGAAEQNLLDAELLDKNLQLTKAQKTARLGDWWYDIATRQTAWSDNLFALLDIESLPKNTGHFEYYISHVLPDDRRSVYQFFADVPSNKHQVNQHKILTDKGTLKYFRIVRGEATKDKQGNITRTNGIIQDISDYHEIESSIKKPQVQSPEVQDNYKMVLETIKLAAISLDKNGEIIFCNKYLANLLGYEQQELIGMNWYNKFVSENLKPVFNAWYQSKHIKTEYASPVICRDGEERTINWQNTTIYDNDGQIKQTTSIGEDITELQKDRDLLITAKEKAEKTSQFKTEFLATMSHEIRNPMNAVIGTTNILLDESPRPDQLDYLNSLKHSGENLLGVIDDILDYNKIEEGKLELHKSNFNIHKLTASTKHIFTARAHEKKLDIFVDTEDTIPQNLIGDAIRISQIFNHLLNNAIKFTNKGSVTLLVQEETRNDKTIRLNFTVADTGIGIDPKNLRRVFEPFVQEQHVDAGGAGLGLAIIKHIIELHDSKITIKSTPGKGTQFTFTIEFEYTPDPVKASTPPPAPQIKEADLSGMKVLIVDDNKLNRVIAGRFLSKWNVSINEASDGQIATEMADGNNYDLILMDLQMPVMDGFTASEIIKEKHPTLPIIALTADAMPETFTKTVAFRIDDYLVKPFMPEMLYEKVSKYYKQSAKISDRY